MNFRAVWGLLGKVLLLLGAMMILPAVVGIGYGENRAALGCLAACVVVVLAGWGLMHHFKAALEDKQTIHRREGLAVVGLSWLIGGLAAALPFLFTGTLVSPVDACFEAISGLTTTGSTVMTPEQIDGLDHAIAFWRSFCHWLGGFGIVMVFVVFFPTGGRSLFRSEIPGVAREASHRRVQDSARILLKLYVFLTILEFLLLQFAGMDAFDGMIHAFGTIPTGGFSNHGSSVMAFQSASIEVVLTLFMFICGFNFGLYETLMTAGPGAFMRKLWASSEARAYIGIMVGATLLLTMILWFDGGTNGGPPLDARPGWQDYSSLTTCVRDSSFLVVSLGTSTGFGSANFDLWPQIARIVLMMLAVVGACAGSTGGGIKVVRCMIVVKAAIVGVRRFIRPRAVHTVHMDGQALEDGVVASITAYFCLWTVVFLFGTLFLSAYGLDLTSAGTAVLATLNNIGPGLAAVGPWENFSALPDLPKIVLALFMIVGRLEFYAVAALCVPSFWRQ
ncbi:MAG: potassium transporter [Planctomycetes bacterium]|nr:potassium transporter [Planctomycetota bacterium]